MVLPVPSPSSPSPAKASPDPAPPGDAGCVLLAVDEPSIGQMLVHVCANAGLKGFWVGDLGKGLLWLAENRQSTGLVFLDCHQSEAESRAFCRSARIIRPGLPILVAGPAEATSSGGNLAAEGSAIFVAKPYLPTELAWQLRAQLEHPPA